jgi:hypothetical protein
MFLPPGRDSRGRLCSRSVAGALASTDGDALFRVHHPPAVLPLVDGALTGGAVDSGAVHGYALALSRGSIEVLRKLWISLELWKLLSKVSYHLLQ